MLSGCAASQTSPFDRPSPEETRIQITVENRDFSDATVYAETIRRRERLGIVSGKGTASFTVQWLGVQDLAIRIDLLAGQSHTTRRLTVAPGDSLRLYIERPFNRTVLER